MDDGSLVAGSTTGVVRGMEESLMKRNETEPFRARLKFLAALDDLDRQPGLVTASRLCDHV